MKSFEGYLKLKLGDTYVLLAGGGHKSLNDFLLSLPAHEHNKITYSDTRDTIENPNDVVGFNGIQIHFKDKSKSLIPSSGSWTTIIYFDGYSDATGGYPAEMGFSMSDLDANRPFYLRSPKSATEWGSWRKILDTGNSSVSGGGSSLGSSITVNIGGDQQTLTIPSSIAWSSITSKPDMAIRWPTWDEVTDKPSSFNPSSHNHYRIKLSDDRAKYPGQLTGNDTMSIFGGFIQNSTLGISNFGDYSDVLVIRSYHDFSGGNDNAIIFNKNTRGVWHTQFTFGSTTSWGTPYLFLDSNNSSVSGGGSSLGSSITVNLGGSSKTLTIPSSVNWASIDDKPATYSPSSHEHYLILPIRHDNNIPLPDAEVAIGFQFSYINSDWWNVLNMRSYGDYRYQSAQLLTPAGNPGSDSNYGDMYWREGRNKTWLKFRKVLDDDNSSVSLSGSTLTVTLGGVSKSLTNTNTWRDISDSYSGTSSSISLSQKGGNDLYNALVNGYASSAGSATRTRYVTCPDTRDSMPAPGDYSASTTGVSFDFKSKTASGLTGSAYYAGIMTVRPYASGQDWSGGPAHQLAFNGDGRLLHRTGTSSWGSWVVVVQTDTSGNITATNFYTTSDARKKLNVHKISDNIKQFEWKETGETSYGFVAQDLEAKHPELVNDDGNMKTVNYNAALSLVVAKLENRVKELEAKLGLETSPYI